MKRDIIYIEVIAKTDYEAIRGLMTKDFPDTFDRWRQGYQRRINHYTGHEIREGYVRPDQLSAYLRRTGYAADTKALLAVAEIAWIGNSQKA